MTDEQQPDVKRGRGRPRTRYFGDQRPTHVWELVLGLSMPPLIHNRNDGWDAGATAFEFWLHTVAEYQTDADLPKDKAAQLRWYRLWPTWVIEHTADWRFHYEGAVLIKFWAWTPVEEAVMHTSLHGPLPYMAQADAFTCGRPALRWDAGVDVETGAVADSYYLGKYATGDEELPPLDRKAGRPKGSVKRMDWARWVREDFGFDFMLDADGGKAHRAWEEQRLKFRNPLVWAHDPPSDGRRRPEVFYVPRLGIFDGPMGRDQERAANARNRSVSLDGKRSVTDSRYSRPLLTVTLPAHQFNGWDDPYTLYHGAEVPPGN